VLNERLQPVPAGVEADLYMGGNALAHGYLNHPVLTRECFVPDPFNAGAESRLVKSGQRARWTNRGILEILGRQDQRIHINGRRIEPAEVEAILARQPDVLTVDVVSRQDGLGGGQVAAHIVPRGRGPYPWSDRGLREFLHEIFPEYMTPAIIFTVGDTPPTEDNRFTRPESQIDRPPVIAGPRPQVSARNELERMLVEIWRDLLGLETIGVFDNFFDIGGHSLVAAELVGRVREALSVDISLRSFFEAPTIAGQAEQIEAQFGGEE
jgi:hypothetical protein